MSPSEVSSLSHQIEDGDAGRVLALAGRLDADSTGAVWTDLARAVETAPGSIVIHAEKVDYCDGFGAGLLLDLQRRALAKGRALRIEGLQPAFQEMVGAFDPEHYKTLDIGRGAQTSAVTSIGQAATDVVKDLRGFVTFIGELALALIWAVRNPRSVRWKDAIRTAEVAGADALPVVVLVGFLIGFVMAFQSAIPMREYGADVFVASLVGLAMVRELGPIMTAVALAGRSGAAFAAELGTMKVNEEISALTTMGLSPARFLIVPRVIAAVLMTPILTIFANAAGIAGGYIVFISLGHPTVLFQEQLRLYIDMNDLMGGLIKAFVFGMIVAGVGCMRGLQTTTGASAVGRSTTSAVVSSIVIVSLTDGLFSVIYFFLDF